MVTEDYFETRAITYYIIIENARSGADIPRNRKFHGNKLAKDQIRLPIRKKRLLSGSENFRCLNYSRE